MTACSILSRKVVVGAFACLTAFAAPAANYTVVGTAVTNAGIVKWNLDSGTNYNNIATNPVYVILPTAYGTNQQYKVLYIGQVNGGDTGGIAEAKNQGIADKYGLICVQNVFPNDEPLFSGATRGWGVNAESNTPYIIQDDRYWVEVVVPFIDATYSTLAANTGRTTLGFSKAGFCAINLLLRHPDVFGRAGSWDGGGVNTGNRPEFQMSNAYCSSNFDMGNLLSTNRALFTNQLPRFALTGWNTLSNSVYLTHNAMVADGIPHYYSNDIQYPAHAWNSGWFAPLVDVLMRPNMTNAPGVSAATVIKFK